MNLWKHGACWTALGIGFSAPAQPVTAEAVQASPMIRWRSGSDGTVQAMTRAGVAAELTRLASRAAGTHAVVSLDAPPTASRRAELASKGVRLLSPLGGGGGGSYFAAIDARVDGLGAADSGIRGVMEIPPEHKLHPDLANGIVRSWMLPRDAFSVHPRLRGHLESGMVTARELKEHGADPLVALLVVFHRDQDLVGESGRVATRLGGRVVSLIGSVNAVTLHVPWSRLSDLAADDAVQWIEPPLPMMTDLNAENRALVGADILNAAPYGLDGTGVTVLVYDGGRMNTHADFQGRLIHGASDTSSISGHATHVGGTIGGAGVIEYANRGMAPGVGLVSYGLQQGGSDTLTPGFLYSDPGDIEADYAEAIGLYGADIANNSIGTNVAANGFPCEWTGNYGVTCALIDAVVRGSLGGPMRVVWANGNERSRTRCLGDDMGNHGEFYSTAPPAGAKNHISVGSVDSDTDLISYFSSWGPVDDGRIKPDISAPGCESGAGLGVLSTTGTSGYGSLCGTSMAAPTVTGIAALILEAYRIEFPPRADPMNATLKALLANTAVDRGNPGPDYAYGFGSVRGDAAVDAVIARNVLEGVVAQDGVYRFTVEFDAGEGDLRVTVAWDDVPGTPNVGDALVNDLDLRVIDPTGAVHLPWTLNPSDPSAPAVRNARDRVNNIEQVQIDNAATGSYTVEVIGTLIADGSAQTFGAASNGLLSPCSRAGFVALGASRAPCSGETTVRVVDCDLNTSDAVIDTAEVLVYSGVQAGAIVVQLTETAPDSAEFIGSFAFGDGSGGSLAVLSGDVVTALYIDADDGAGGSGVQVTAEMVIDCDAPALLSRILDGLWYNRVDVLIGADERVSCRVLYGESGGPMNRAADSLTLIGQTHVVRLAGLDESTDYVYAVELTDMAGNVLLDDNAGAGYPFRTIRGPLPVYEFLVDDTDPGWDRTGDWEFGPATGLRGNPPQAYSGVHVFGYDLDDWFPWHMDREYLTTGVMDFTGVYEVRLGFQRWLGLPPSVTANASVEVQVGEGDWQVVWRHSEGRMSPTAWEFVSYGPLDIVANQPAVRFRWVMGESGVFIDECGWNIDDIVLTGVIAPVPCPPDMYADGRLDFFDIMAFLSAYGAMDPSADFADPVGVLNFFDVASFLEAFMAGCP